MKGLARLLALGVFALAAWWLAPYLVELDVAALLGRDREAWKLEMVPQASISATYLAERERWLSFPVPAGASRIRVVSNASLVDIAEARAARSADPQRRWRYALDLEVVDGAGKVLLQRRHHHRTDIAELRLPDGRVVTPAYYLNEALSPATGVVVTLNLAGLPQAAQLRIRAADMDRDLGDVAVRAYFPEPISERQVEHLWDRLSERQKSSLAKGSVYAHELLTDAERRNLLHNQWQPAGPQGAQGVAFRQRDLYVLHDVEGEAVDNPVPPNGLVATPGRMAVFALPEQGGTVHFEAVPVATGESSATPSVPPGGAMARLGGRWYGADALARAEVTLQLNADRNAGPGKSVLRAERHFDGGLLEFEAPTPLALRAYMDIGGVRTEITPERIYQRLFVADSARPVSFAIAHEGAAATPVRVEVRQLHHAAPPARPSPLHYAFTSSDGAVLREGELALERFSPAYTPASRYDEAIGALPGTVVSDAVEVYFSVPPAATGLRLAPGGDAAAQAPLLVGLATRPARLPRQVRAPEDHFDYGAQGKRVPAWFPVHPTDYARLITDNRSQLVAVQSRPPEDRPERVSGQFTWEDFRPQGRWLARQLLTPREAAEVPREEALISTYSPLASGRTQRLDFQPWMGLRQLAPALLWIAPDDTPFAATVLLDGRPHHVFGGHGRYGETRLPPLPAGPHELRVDFSPPGKARPQFFINLVRPGPQAYVLRFAARLGGEIAFDVERTGRDEETVTARLFQPGGWRGRTQLAARIEGPGPAPLTPLPGWLFDERRFDVRPDPSWAAPVFDTRGARSDAGRPVQLVFPLGTPPGRYRVVFRLEQGPPGYLAVSRITPGTQTRRRIFEEAEVRNVVVE
jgi:hypothetical protein